LDEHDPPHFHAEYQGNKAVFAFNGNVTKGALNSKTATRLVREWIDLRLDDLTLHWMHRTRPVTSLLGVITAIDRFRPPFFAVIA
jgi:hypothetical protein